MSTNAAKLWQSERLVYRAAEVEDEAFLTSFYADAESYANATLSLASPPGKDTGTEWRDYIQKKALLGVLICLPAPVNPAAVNPTVEHSRPVPIGVLTLTNSEAQHRHHLRAMIGVNILRSYQGQGYGSEAIRWSLKWSFNFANLHRVEIGAVGYNPRALKLYEKLGFVTEGRKREAVYFDGQYWDLVEMGMLKAEWIQKYGSNSDASV